VAWDAEIRRLARLKAVAMAETMPKGAVQIVLGDAVVGLPIADVIDLKAEKSRLGKDLTKLRDEIGKINAKLGNAAFMAKAPEHVVEEQQERRTDAEALVVKTEAAIRRLDEL